MKKLNAGIIGCGCVSYVHAEALIGNENSNLVAVADIKEDRAKEAATKYNCSYYTDYKEMLSNKDIDVIHICTPHYLHAPMAIEAVKAGKHVLTEKPVAITVAEAKRMAEAARMNNRHIAVCFQNRYNNTSVKAKELLDQGILGKVHGIKGLVTWSRDKTYYTNSDWRGRWATEGGGVMINQAIHVLDLMQWMAGDIAEIKGSVDTRVLQDVIEVEDTAEATMYYQNGAIGIFYATNAYSITSSAEIEIHCEGGTLRIKDNQLMMDQGGKKQYINVVNDSLAKYKSYWGNSHANLIYDYYRCLCEKREGFITVEEGMKSLALIESIYRSSSERKRVSVMV